MPEAPGFAAAVQPVSAATITTDAACLDAGDAAVTAEVPAYYAMPKDGKSLPLVLVVQEIFGVHEHIRDVCRRLAKLGYLAVAPSLYTRQGDVSELSDMQQIRKIVAQVPDAQVLADLDAVVAWARREHNADAARLGITGFCWGGRIVWLYAAHRHDLQAGVAWYGRLMGDRDALHPRHPIDIAGELKAPVLGLYGARDQGIPVASVEQMRAALAQAERTAELVVYPNAGHAFFADYRPGYVEEAARDGWQRMLGWLNRFGVT